MRKEVIDVVVDLEPMSIKKTFNFLKEKDLLDPLKGMVSAGRRDVFDTTLCVLSTGSDEFTDIYLEEIDKIGHDLLWEAVLAEVGEQDSVEDQIRRLEEEIKALKERKEDDLK